MIKQQIKKEEEAQCLFNDFQALLGSFSDLSVM